MVEPAISKMVSDRMRLRPRRSPKAPKTMPPKGRRANATANTAKVLSKATLASSLAKNWLAISVARKPYTAKSNHSTKLPMAEAAITLRRVAGDTS
ncbi:hypothetical protein D3C76_1091980 [compost metagenome]